MSTAGWAWWGVMTTISAANFAILGAALLAAGPGSGRARPRRERAALRAAAVIFTAVCAYRAVLPRVDVPRKCWFDSPLNWTIFGRVGATFAEVAWAVQLGLSLRRLAACLHEDERVSVAALLRASRAGFAVIAMACIAECCSWTNLITEDNLFAVFEQFLWSVLFLFSGVGTALLLPMWPERPASYVWFTVLAIGMGVEQGFEAFGLYLPRFLDDRRDGTHYYGFSEGISRLCECASVTRDLGDWASDAAWMTGYFSVAVWSSIWLAVAPLPRHAKALLPYRCDDGGAGSDAERGGDAEEE